MTRRHYTLERFQVLNDFVDHGLADLSRSEIAVYMILFRDTRPTGLARTSLTELSRAAVCPSGRQPALSAS